MIIPVYNEEEILGHCLQSIVEHPYHGSFEVIVVDNNSTDRTMGVVRSFNGLLVLRELNEPKQGRGAARALGCAHARGDILFCIDADTEITEGWLDAMAHEIRKPGTVAATGYGVVRDLSPFRNIIINTYALAFNLAMGLSGNYWINGYASGFRRTAYETVGGFDTESDLGEDTDLGFHLRTMGHIGFVRKPSIIISGRRYKKGLLHGWWQYFWGFVQKFIFRKRTVWWDNQR